MSIKSLQRTTLRDQCLNALRSAITTGQLPPGHHLVETDLSNAFGVSRGTLREAMRRLEQEGLLVAGARGQLSIRYIDSKEVLDIYRVRTSLETLAARLICDQPEREAHIARLAAQAEKMARLEGNLTEQIEADMGFHRLLCQLSGNEVLLKTWATLEGPIRICIMSAGLERALHNMAAERHVRIIDAMREEDGDRTAAVLANHMQEAALRLSQALHQQADEQMR
ncbi:GntR family transcriptional regulator [Kushneria phyllosphaerae]|uniref:Putative D-xylose utilization operon transcriptional repressor n=1 Tax=Kushneria phyllosphaerae TaxID=2100822 RepID=A0A2R8CGL1_9GAMM|nr:GntR family transcriptional regulator [Kushneria phyllosphaerae]SPJ32029.1 putative D-xylose utilization operon transcriptional repressor [Kushneria phyllosphaerae]